MTATDYQVLKSLSLVDGLSAHFSPVFIESQLTNLLTQIGVQQVCEQNLEEVKADLSKGWICSSCGYKSGKKLEIKPEHILALVQRGIKEFLDHVRGCEAELRDYVSDTPAASPLLGLLSDPVESSAVDLLDDAVMRGYLAEALAEAEALRVNVDELLEQLKPRLLGFFKGGRREFEQYVQGELGELLKKSDSTEEEHPWKVE